MTAALGTLGKPRSFPLTGGAVAVQQGNLSVQGQTAPSGLSVSEFRTNLGIGSGVGGAMYYASSWPTPDGKIIRACIGTHGNSGPEAFNSVWEYDPLNTAAGEVEVYPNNFSTVDWSQHDNLPQLFSARLNALILFGTANGTGVFVRSPGTYAGVVQATGNAWIMGNLMSNGRKVVGTGATDLINGSGLLGNNWLTSNWIYNPFAAWSAEFDCGVIVGGAPGGASEANSMFIIVPAKNINASFTQEYYAIEKTMPATVGGAKPYAHRARDGMCFLGEYVYWVGGTDYAADVSKPHFFRMRITPHLFSTSTSITSGAGAIERLTDCPVADLFMLLAPDKYNSGLVCITGSGVFLYDLTTQTWSAEVTPAAYRAEYSAPGFGGRLPRNSLGGFIDTRNGTPLRKVYFRPGTVDANQGPASGIGDQIINWQTYRSIKIQRGGSRWRSIDLPANTSPFKGLAELGFGTNKHVRLEWHPKHRRVYSCSGDYGYGSSSFGQPEPGSSMTTNQPTGARTYTGTDSLRMDMYSFDPYDPNKGWRLEHPYLPRNIGGSPEDKPAYTDHTGWVYDPVRDKFWNFQGHIRDDQSGIPRFLADGTTLDPWANGTMFRQTGAFLNPWETVGTYSWKPSPTAGAGTWTKETNNYVWGSRNHWPPVYDGTCLRLTGASSADHAYIGAWAYHAATDRFVTLLMSGDVRLVLLSFNPTTFAYEWRLIDTPQYNFLGGSGPASVVTLGDHVYTPVSTRTTGSVRQSLIFKVNVTTALAQPNGSTLGASFWTTITTPFTFSPNGEWENLGDGSTSWSGEVGLCVLDSSLVLIRSYADRFIVGGVTALASYDGTSWTMAESFPATPGTLQAQAWVALPDTGEIMLLPAQASPQSKIWFYRVSGAGTTSSSNFTDSFSTDTGVNGPLASPWVGPNVSGFFNVRAVGGIACGVAAAASNNGYPDCYAYHPGFTGNYEIEATIFKSPSINMAINHEVELHVCFSQNGTTVQNVEFLVNAGGQWQVMRWNGINDGSGSFFNGGELGAGTTTTPATGHKMRFRKVGTTGTAYYSIDGGTNWSTLWTGTLPFSSGSPGIGFFYRLGATTSHYGFEDVTIRPL